MEIFETEGWPSHFDQTPDKERTEKKQTTTPSRSECRQDILRELKRLNALTYEIFTVPPGVVVGWVQNEQRYAVACDKHKTIRANYRQVYYFIQEMRRASNRPVQTSKDLFSVAALDSVAEDDVVDIDSRELTG